MGIWHDALARTRVMAPHNATSRTECKRNEATRVTSAVDAPLVKSATDRSGASRPMAPFVKEKSEIHIIAMNLILDSTIIASYCERNATSYKSMNKCAYK